MKLKFIFLSIFLASTIASKSQTYRGNDDYFPPAPNAYNLSRLNNTSVNLYTGTANIDLPLAEIPSRTLKLPISLSYNSSGVKVQDIASSVGLGWNLNVGGVITRVVRGLPDENADGFSGTNHRGAQVYLTPTSDYIKNVSSHQWDSEPDLFYFNFLGNSGMFILDENGVAVLMPYQNIKISGSPDSGWILVDGAGMIYSFGTDPTSCETSSYQSGSTTSSAVTFKSSWYLSQISTANQDDNISFSYDTYISGSSNTSPESVSPFSYKYFMQSGIIELYYKLVGNAGGDLTVLDQGCSNTGATSYSTSDLTITVQTPVYIKQITTAQAKVIFYRDNTRTDLPGAQRIVRFVVNDNLSNQSYGLNFHYSYFVSDNCTSVDPAQCQRLKLTGISKIGNVRQQRLYAFEYNNTNLPSRDSNAIDHWGYYNSNTFVSKLVGLTATATTASCPTVTFQGADRSVDTIKTKANILTKVYLPTGGYTEYIYSVHQYSDDGITSKPVGGVRIQQIRQCSDGQNCTTKTYSYYVGTSSVSSGILLTPSLPKYYIYTSGYSSNGAFGYVRTSDLVKRYSNSLTDLFDINGFHIGYSQVRERTVGLGYTESIFSDLHDHPDGVPTQYSYTIDISNNLSSPTNIGSNEFPYTPSTSKNAERGRLSNKTYYDENRKILKQEIYHYNFSIPALRTIPAYKVGYQESKYVVGHYYHISQPYILDVVTTTNYDPSDPGNESKTQVATTNLSYVPVDPAGQSAIAMDLQARKISQVLPNGEKFVTEKKYLTDYNYSSNPGIAEGLYVLKGKNVSNTLIESINYIEKPVGGVTTKFLLEGNINLFKTLYETTGVYVSDIKKIKVGSLPTFTTFPWSSIVNNAFTYQSSLYKTTFSVKSSNPWFNANVDGYGIAGNLLAATGEEGIPVSYEWTYNNTLVSSKTLNADAGTLSHKVNYQSKPLIGVSQITDANNANASYVYDEYARLKLTLNNDNGIASRYTYHYKDEDKSLVAASVSFNILPPASGQQYWLVNFSSPAEDQTGYVEPITYNWDFGDGTTQATTVPNVIHQYPHGSVTYTIKLVKSHPSYSPTSALTTMHLN